MRPASLRVLALSCLVVAAGSWFVVAAPADVAPLHGTYKAVLCTPLQELELLIITFEPKQDALKAEVKDHYQLPGGTPSVTKATQKGDKVDLEIQMLGSPHHFSGTVGDDGVIRGSMVIQANQPWGFRLEKARVAKVGEPRPSAFRNTFIQAMQEKDQKARTKALAELAKDPAVNGPSAAPVFLAFLQSASAADVPATDVQQAIDGLIKLVKPYGDVLVAGNEADALKALKSGKEKYADVIAALEKRYVPLEMKLATEAEKELGESAPADLRSRAAARVAAVAKLAGDKALEAEADQRSKSLEFEAALAADKELGKDAPAENRVRSAMRLAAAAKLAGKPDVAKDAEARVASLDKELDEEYHKNVPPFKPEAVSRKDKDSDRVVLLELFTGAQCPPCVAADVAFDALNDSYKPTDLVTLQYHLHIPGPDPLTNSDSEARADYYELRGTPSVYFNGKPQAGGGGAMAAAKSKYEQYRETIDSALEGKKDAKVELKVSREGDDVKILATAEGPSGGKSGSGKLKLRLALTEEQIKYVGGNRLRFHHHVVRGMPGGPEGTALADGKATADLTVKLSDVVKGLETYVSDYARENNAFTSTPLPPIELKDLSVVAFLQDDDSKEVLDVIVVPVEAK